MIFDDECTRRITNTLMKDVRLTTDSTEPVATHCNTLQHTTTHCNTQQSLLQHTVIHYNTLQHATEPTHCNTLQHSTEPFATHCNTLQHTATHCNTLQHSTEPSMLGIQITRVYTYNLTRMTYIHILMNTQMKDLLLTTQSTEPFACGILLTYTHTHAGHVCNQ